MGKQWATPLDTWSHHYYIFLYGPQGPCSYLPTKIILTSGPEAHVLVPLSLRGAQSQPS